MRITFKNFIVRPCPAATSLFDLYEVRQFQAGKRVGENYEEALAFGIPLINALRSILKRAALNEFSEETIITLEEYINTLKILNDEIGKLGDEIGLKLKK